MTDDSLIEVMARAACEANHGPWDMMTHSGQEAFRSEQRAAHSALRAGGYAVVKREPTGHFLQAAYERLDNYTRAELDEIWTAMLEASEASEKMEE